MKLSKSDEKLIDAKLGIIYSTIFALFRSMCEAALKQEGGFSGSPLIAGENGFATGVMFYSVPADMNDEVEAAIQAAITEIMKERFGTADFQKGLSAVDGKLVKLQ